MARSRKKHSAAKICGHSNKQSKRFANRRFRKLTKQLLKEMEFWRTETEKWNSIVNEEYRNLPNSLKEVSDVYSFDSDGLAHWIECPDEHHPNPYWNEEAWKKIMRK